MKKINFEKIYKNINFILVNKNLITREEVVLIILLILIIPTSINNKTSIYKTYNIEVIIENENVNSKNEDGLNFCLMIFFYNNDTNSLGDNAFGLNTSIIKSEFGIIDNSLNIEKIRILIFLNSLYI